MRTPTRPSESWQNIVSGIYCPRDVRGGTWIGCNDHGLFCALTNWDRDEEFPVRDSRGDVVLSTLCSEDVDQALLFWNHMSGENYRPFNVLAGTKDRLVHLSCDGYELETQELGVGLHVSTGWGLNIDNKRDKIVRNRLRSSFRDFSQPVDPFSITGTLITHTKYAYDEDAVCVHDEAREWETVSSAKMVLDSEGWLINYADKGPCKATCSDWKEIYVKLRNS